MTDADVYASETQMHNHATNNEDSQSTKGMKWMAKLDQKKEILW